MVIKKYKKGWPCAFVSDDESVRVSHYGELQRLSRVQGQVYGIKRMIKGRDRSCVMVIKQLLSASAVILKIAGYILERHENYCLNPDNFPSDRETLEYQQKISEKLKIKVDYPEREPEI